MTDQVDTIDPKDVIFIAGGKIITGYGQDTYIEISRESNQIEDDVGAEGDVGRRVTNDKRGNIVITLLQTSRSNLILSGFARLDELTGDGIFPVIIKDNRGNDLHVAPNSWIQKMPDTTYLSGIAVRAWPIRCSNLQMVVGGAS